MRTERKQYKDGTRKLYTVENDGTVKRCLIISTAKNIIKHI